MNGGAIAEGSASRLSYVRRGRRRVSRWSCGRTEGNAVTEFLLLTYSSSRNRVNNRALVYAVVGTRWIINITECVDLSYKATKWLTKISWWLYVAVIRRSWGQRSSYSTLLKKWMWSFRLPSNIGIIMIMVFWTEQIQSTRYMWILLMFCEYCGYMFVTCYTTSEQLAQFIFHKRRQRSYPKCVFWATH